MSPLEEALYRAHQLSDRVASAIEGKPIDVTRRKLLAAAAFQLSIEHHRATIILVENKAIGSALALTRPVIETFARGHWLCYIASNEQVDCFLEGRFQPKFDYLLRKLTEENPQGPPLETMQRMASRAHDLTHGGIGHLVRRLAPKRLGPSYTTDEVAAALGVATWGAGMSALDLVGTAIGDETLASALNDEFLPLFKPSSL